jgi:hypothetical protein
VTAQPSGSPDLQKEAYGVLLLLQEHLPKNYSLDLQNKEELVIDALRSHGDHLSLISIQQNRVDAFKLACWLSRSILRSLEADPSFSQHLAIVESLLKTLEEILFLDTDGNVRFSKEDRELLRRMAMAEIKGECDHGIGANGLYIAFHAAWATFISLHQQGKLK